MVDNIKKKSGLISKNVERLYSRSGNKTLYLIAVEDPFVTSGKRLFVSKYAAELNFGVQMVVGYEIDYRTKNVESEEQALLLVNKGTREIFSITFPWNKVVSFRNVTYKIPE